MAEQKYLLELVANLSEADFQINQQKIKAAIQLSRETGATYIVVLTGTLHSCAVVTPTGLENDIIDPFEAHRRVYLHEAQYFIVDTNL